MTPQEIMDGLRSKNRELTIRNEELTRLTADAAEKKRAYLVAYAQKATALKLDGLSITLIQTLAKGDKAVADLQFQWDVADGVLLACRERLKDLRASIDTYRSLLAWLKAELTNTNG